MYVLILSKSSGLKGLLHYALSRENCTCKTVRNLTSLFSEIRLRVPDCIILDKESFPCQNKHTEVDLYLRTNLFDKFDFEIFLYDRHNAKNLCSPVFTSKVCGGKIKRKTEKLLCIAVKNLERLNKTPEEFRPAEKRLYSLLKYRAEEALSLEEMSFALWGVHTQAHKKTLYTYIHRINHILKRIGSRPESLKKTKKGCYKLTFENL